MNIMFWISLGLFVTSLTLFLIFYFKGFELPRKIFEALIFPTMGALTLSSLATRLPDSTHMIYLVAMSYIFCTACLIVFFFSGNVKCRIAARSLFLFSTATWFALFRSTFYLYKVLIPLVVISALVYFGLFIFICFLLGKQMLSRYFWCFFSIAISSLLHFCSVVTLFANHTLYSIILFIGTTELSALVIYYLLLYKKGTKKHSNLILSTMLFSSQLLISLSCFLMIH